MTNNSTDNWLRRSLFLLLACFSLSTVWAQGDDFGMWYEVGAEKKLSSKWSAGLDAEFRTRDDAKTADRWSLGASVDYRLLKTTSFSMKASGGYTLLYDNNTRTSYFNEYDDKVIDGDAEIGDPKKCAHYWGVRHRFFAGITASQKFGDFKFSLRERWQYTYRPSKTVSERWSYLNEAYDGKEHTYSGKAKNILRSRLLVEYSKRKAPLTPYVSVELFNAWNLLKTRYTVGTDWKVAKHHNMGFFYRYQTTNDNNDNEANRHVVGISYNYNF